MILRMMTNMSNILFSSDIIVSMIERTSTMANENTSKIITILL